MWIFVVYRFANKCVVFFGKKKGVNQGLVAGAGASAWISMTMMMMMMVKNQWKSLEMSK